MGYANAGGWLGSAAVIVPMAIAVLMPSLGSRGGPSNRSQCGANLRGLAQSMNVYAADNGGVYPLLPYAPYHANNSGPLAVTVAASTQPDAATSMFGGAGAQDGSVLASAWLLVLNNYMSPKQFICQSDPFKPAPTPPKSPPPPANSSSTSKNPPT